MMVSYRDDRGRLCYSVLDRGHSYTVTLECNGSYRCTCQPSQVAECRHIAEVRGYLTGRPTRPVASRASRLRAKELYDEFFGISETVDTTAVLFAAYCIEQQANATAPDDLSAQLAEAQAEATALRIQLRATPDS